MEYVELGRSGLKVSRLACGLGFRGQEDAGEAERAIERAVELGVNFIDCANVYGTGGRAQGPRHLRAGIGPCPSQRNRYHLLDRQLEREMWPAQRDQGFGVMTHSPLAVGLLSGAYTPDHPPPTGVLYARGRAGELEKERDLEEAVPRTLAILREVADAHGRTMAQTAINWVLSHPEVTAAVTGGDTAEHMEENAGAVGWSITPEDRARLDEASVGQRPGSTVT